MSAANGSRNQQVAIRKHEHVRQARPWHVACDEHPRTKIKSTVVGCGEGNAQEIVVATSIILEPEEDL